MRRLTHESQQSSKSRVDGRRVAIKHLAMIVLACALAGGLVLTYGAAQAETLPGTCATQQPVPVGFSRSTVGADGIALVKQGWAQIIHGGEPLFALVAPDSQPVGNQGREKQEQNRCSSREPVYQVVIEHRSVQVLVTIFVALLLGGAVGILIGPLRDMFGLFWDIFTDWRESRR